MEQLVKEILSISKLEMNTMSHTELLSLSNILKRVYKHLIPLANEKHIRIQKNISEDVMMMGNELLLEKAVHNIISNAIRHSPVGAELGLELSFEMCIRDRNYRYDPQSESGSVFSEKLYPGDRQ